MSSPPAEMSGQSGTFGSSLRTLRESAGLTQEELAERAGLTAYAVSALERGRRQRPYPHTVRSLADALGLSDAERARLLDSVPRRTTASSEPVADDARPASASVPPGGMLPAVTRLLGRDAEIATVRELLLHSEHHLVSLTGTGGVGKTRLATALAEEVGPSFPDGTAVVSLAPLSDPAAVITAVCRAVGSPVVEGPESAVALADHLRPLRYLLVLDNLEHLPDAAQQVARLVRHCPRLVVLVTSRAPLRVRGELEYRVQPLGLPDEDEDPRSVATAAAVEVFVDRARAVSPGFEVTAENAAAVAALCRRLAGIPLALELAAARIRFLSPAALLSRLDEAMSRAGGPDLPARQRTMKATFDWSYDLLQPGEQDLLRMVSVFVGGCSLDAVEDVAERLGLGEPVLPLLEVLVEQSLVVASADAEGNGRFSLLEPVAQYARSRQDDAELRRARDAHAACYLAFAERAAPEYLAGEQVVWLDRAERDDPNLVAAIGWALESGDADTAGRMCWALWLFWWLRGRLAVGRRLTEAALPLELAPPVRHRATNTAAAMSFGLGDLAAAGPLWQTAADLAATDQDALAFAQSTAGVGLVALASGDLDTAEQLFATAMERSTGTDGYTDWLRSLCDVWQGTVRMVRGDLDGAVRHMQSGLASARTRGDRLSAYVALYNLSQVAIAQGEHAVARERLREGMRLTQETGDRANLVHLLRALAVVEAATGEPTRVAVLLGAADAVSEVAGGDSYGYYTTDEALLQAARTAAQEALGEDLFDDVLDAGRALTPDEAITYALTGEGAALPA